jgi:amidohydrolase
LTADGDNRDQLRAAVTDAMERLAGPAVELATRIYENPELSGDERRARQWCAELLSDGGFDVEGVEGVETAFVATSGSRDRGPTIGLLAEYDALPGVGHACGHHLIAGSAVAAGLALRACGERLAGTVRVFGCPAEETLSGKPAMLDAGAFEGTDVALTFHANDATTIMTSCTGHRELELSFSGRPSHAASAPWEGASALDGVLLTFQNVNALRQFVRDGVRIHGIVTDGGQAANVIPAHASCRLCVRSTDLDELERVAARVLDCARAGALASNTELSVERGAATEPVRVDESLASVLRGNLEGLGERVVEWQAMASTDFGNVSRVIPSTLFSVKTWPLGTAFHTEEAARAAGREAAFEAMLKGGLAMALTAVDVICDPTAAPIGDPKGA